MKKHLILFALLLAASTAPAVSTIDLNGDWQISGFDPEGTRRISDLSGRVPGQVHPDLERAGLIPDPFWRDQADQCQWVEHWEWRYQRTFKVPADFPQQWTMLQFDGLDTYATILLNGKQVGTSSNMFIPHEFPITGWLKPGINTIEVRFAPAEAAVAGKPPYFAVFDAKGLRPHIRRMQCSFGWDWVHRLVTAGIWQPCRIVSYPNARIQDLFAWTANLTREAADLKLELATEVRSNVATKAHVTIADPAGKTVWEKTVPVESRVTKLNATIRDPQWWWPNGAGEHPLYRVTAEQLADNGAVLDRREIETGLRTVSIERIPDSNATNANTSFTLVVNGTRIFAKGGNWVPADPFPARITPDKYARLLGQAQDAGINMLRSWGGGIYETEDFWRNCDRMGIMVSQDFLMACAKYPEDDPGFTKPLKQEFASAIRMLRNHPSLVFWCGDNELGQHATGIGDWNFKKFHLQVTASLVKELDPSRAFWLSSPWSGSAVENSSPLSGDCHINSQLENGMYESDMSGYRALIGKTVGRFMSEHATGGSPPKRTLLRFMTANDLEHEAMREYHTSDNPYIGRERGLTISQIFHDEADKLYGNSAGDTDRRIRQEEYLQYEFARLGMEAARRSKFWCSGIQLWMFNDCWPAIGWSVLDYWGNRKASWYALAAGCRPVMSAAEVTTNAVHWWVSNDQLQPADVTLEIRVQPWSGKPRLSKKITLTVPANSSVDATNLPLDEIKKIMGNDSALVCDLDSTVGHDRSWWFPGLPLEMKLPPAKLQVSELRGEGEGTITIHAKNWARVVTLDADVDFSDNYFELLPDETRTITWKAPNRSFAGKIVVSCWNP